MRVLIVWSLFLLVTLPLRVGAGDLPTYRAEAHLGVGECAGSPCHGSAAPMGGHIRQNEHTIWFQGNQHSSAYTTLHSDRSKSIARNLGIGPAYKAKECLACHADDAKNRAPTHQLEEGVGCEACHGGGERWLKNHTAPTRTHAQNLSEGMYPTDEPLARAELCVSCHFGDERRFVGHRMLGAGHPRLTFELDSHGLYQPPHYEVDDDYRKRGKVAASNAEFWAMGQAVLARNLLAVLADRSRSHDGMWPEFATMDCYTCHHVIGERRRPARASTGLTQHPGNPRLDDSHLLMLARIFDTLDPELAVQLRQDTGTLHAAVSRGVGTPQEVAKRLGRSVDSAIEKLVAWEVSAEQLRGMISGLLQDGLNNEFRDYPGAEQAMQAIQALTDSLHAVEPLRNAELDGLDAAFEALADATKDADRFNPKSFIRGLRQVKEHLHSADSLAER